MTARAEESANLQHSAEREKSRWRASSQEQVHLRIGAIRSYSLFKDEPALGGVDADGVAVEEFAGEQLHR